MPSKATPTFYEASVFGIPTRSGGERARRRRGPSGSALTADEVAAHARAHLAGYKVPRSVTFIDELPKTAPQILKRQLRAPYWADRTPKSKKRRSDALFDL